MALAKLPTYTRVSSHASFCCSYYLVVVVGSHGKVFSVTCKLFSFQQTLLTAYFRAAATARAAPSPSPAPAAPVAPVAVVPSPELNHFRDSARFNAPIAPAQTVTTTRPPVSVLSNNKNMNNSSGPSTSSFIPSSSSMMPSPFHDPFDIMNPFYGPLTYSPASPDYVDPYAFLNNQPSTSSQY